MGKVPKNRKKSKSKLKKKSSSKNKNRSSNQKKNSGAPEIMNINMTSHDIQSVQCNNSNSTKTVFKLIRRAMKVNHIECEEKVIRNAQRTLFKAKQAGIPNEIEEAEKILQEAVQDKEDAAKWMHPDETIEKLSRILNDQVKKSENLDIIEITKELIFEAKDSLRFFTQGQEDAFFFRLVQDKLSLDELKERKNTSLIEDIYSDDEIDHATSLFHASIISNDTNNSSCENNLIDEAQNFTTESIIQAPVKENHEMEIDTSIPEQLEDGQKTPTSSGSNSTPVNVAQKMLQRALTILSPTEKMKKMKMQAKLNAKMRAEKTAKEKIDQELKKKKSEINQKKNESSKVFKAKFKQVPAKSKKSLAKAESTTNKTSRGKSKKQHESDTESKSEIDENSLSTTDSEYMSDNSDVENVSESESENESESDNESDSEIETDSEKESDSDNENESESEHESESESEDMNKYERKNKSKKYEKVEIRSNRKKTIIKAIKTPKSSTKSKNTTQKKISISRTYSEYYSVKLKITKGNVPVRQLVKHLKALYKQLQAIDPTLVIYAYESDLPTEAILKPKDMPSDITIMKIFFSNISVKPNGGHSWFQVWLGHDDSIANILTNMKYWSSENDSYLYRKRLQQKYTAKDYWLMWSTERMDPEVLHTEVSNVIAKVTTKKLHFTFSFGNIRKDPKYSISTNTAKFNKAMIVEVKKEQREETYNMIGRIFSTTCNKKILGLSMRMVPMMSNDLPSHTKMKVAHLIAKQEQYLSTLRVKSCVYLQEIDYFNIDLNTTLRDIIMNLETLHTFDKNQNSMKVFTNVDYSAWHSCYVLTYPSHLSKEADDYISQLPSYLHYVYGDEVLLMLTAEGQSKAQTSTWDPEKLCATSNLDLELDAVTSESANLMWLPDLQTELVQFDTSNINLQNRIFEKATDADSVSTFKPAGNSTIPPIVSQPPKRASRSNESNSSNDQTRESGRRNHPNKTSKAAESSLGGPL